ncbi:hydroxyacylglutathione hydrolase [Hydrogenophaga sp. A37]|uniref:hydroxyacylglutathione hydrolase n=1 Tax=Hydrogenophaga sp. A37 TaxID=1945864 RepID=UPI000987AE72|nr:hydroxyacylglutathione hydrolase [Hydrogenophaga sp. A37]OOG89020.1 hydroxyacylglutathione hydrolase [Hydrogenophaga sp. A37]
MTLFPVPAFSDNYIWVLHDGQRALVVDPGEAKGVQAWLVQHHLKLDTILITHHHADHVGGVAALRETTGARVIGPVDEPMPEPLQRVGAGEAVNALGLRFDVIEVPGHTSGHIAYFCADMDGAPLLFCGDTLFSAGCGRLFEGTPAQMLESLTRLAALPGNTRVCCTHEYTLSNLRFARAVEPGNAELSAYAAHCQSLRERNLPTLPSSIEREKQINPFLRAHVPAVEQTARAHDPDSPPGPLGVFTTLRAWKNTYQ